MVAMGTRNLPLWPGRVTLEDASSPPLLTSLLLHSQVSLPPALSCSSAIWSRLGQRLREWLPCARLMGSSCPCGWRYSILYATDGSLDWWGEGFRNASHLLKRKGPTHDEEKKIIPARMRLFIY